MDFVILWFVMTAGSGYIEPMNIRDAQCGQAGLVVGVLVDRLVNPTEALWPDPQTVGEHCRVDIRERVAGLAPGEYHLATTIVGKVYPFGEAPEHYNEHDPHTSVLWLRQVGTADPARPEAFRIKPR